MPKRRRRFALPNPLVANRCDYEQATHFGAYWTKAQVLDYAATINPPIPTVDLYAAAATRAGWRAAIVDNSAIFVCGVGHGNESVFTGQNEEILLDRYRAEDKSLMAGRWGSFLSCVFGQAAQDFVDAGMRGFFGYRETYYFMVSAYPDGVAEKFFASHFTFDRSLMNGLSLAEAWDLCKAAYNAAIASADPATAYYLIWDCDAMTIASDDMDAGPYMGDVTPPPPPPEPPSNCPIAKATVTVLNALSAMLGRRTRFMAVTP